MSDIAAPEPAAPKPKYEGRLFLLIVCVELIGAAILSFLRYIPAQWDTLQYFQFQYYFLNSAVADHIVPQWIPYLTHGAIANWLYASQASILQSGFIEIAPLLGHVNLLYCFHAGVFFDKMLLLVGIWLYCRYMSISVPGTFVTAVCLVGSVVWMDQIDWNFHLYYAIPLILYFGHRFLDTGRFRFLILAGNLLAVQMWANVLYVIPVVTLLLALYFFAHVLFNFDDFKQLPRQIYSRWLVPSCLTVAAGLWMAYHFMTIGFSQVAEYSEGRLPDGSTPIDVFMKYAGNAGVFKWSDLVVGVSPAGDFTLYFGMLGAALMVLGVVGIWSRRRCAIAVAILFLLLLASGTWVSLVSYYLWPGMKYFRHLTLINTIVKMFLCVLSGVGFDLLFNYAGRKISRTLTILIGGSLCVWSLALLAGSFCPYLLKTEIVVFLVDSPMSPDFQITRESVVQGLALRSSICGLIAGAVFLFASTRRRQFIAQWIAVLCLLVDVYQFQWTQALLRGTALSKSQLALTMPTHIPFRERRSANYFDGGERANTYGPMVRSQPTYYWTTDIFVFVDEAGNEFRTDFWLRPLDRLLRAFQSQDTDTIGMRLRGKIAYAGFKFPQQETARRIAGITQPKIQFFSHAYALSSHNEIAGVLTDQKFSDNLLLVDPDPSVPGWNSADNKIGANERLSLKYNVTRFDSNDLDLEVSNDTGAACWMMYSDAWSPWWSATVNGHAAPVLCADLAYKAVQLDKGTNHIHFNFNSTPMNVIMHLQRIDSVFWIGMLIVLAVRIARKGTVQIMPASNATDN